MTTLETGRESAAYLQQFVRAHTDDWADLMRGANPNQGYGRGRLARQAYDDAMMLYDYTDQYFRNCVIPDNYASPEHFRQRVLSFGAMLDDAMAKLTAGASAVADRDLVPETVWMVHEALDACRHALDETLRQLGPAVAPPAPGPRNTFKLLEMLAQRFPSVVERMKTRRAPAPPLLIENEYDVQFLFQGLLALYFDDIRPEQPGPSVAGGSSRADTLLRIEKTIVEFKMTGPG